MRMVAEVVNKARKRVQFGRECQPYLLAQQSLLGCNSGVKKLAEINTDIAVNAFERKWDEKVHFFVRDFCCLMALHKLWDHYARVSFVLILPSRVPCNGRRAGDR